MGNAVFSADGTGFTVLDGTASNGSMAESLHARQFRRHLLIGHFTRVAQIIADQKNLSNAEEARLLALVGVALADSAVMALCSTPFWFSLAARLQESSTDTLRIEVCSIDRRIGLLPPRLIQAASIYTIESKLIDELQDDGFGFIIIAGYRQSNSPSGAFGLPQLQQVLSMDIVEGLDHGTVQLLRNPSAFRRSGFDYLDTTVALLRVIISRIHDDDRIGRCREQIARQVWNILFRDCHDDHFSAPGRFGSRHGLRTGLGRQFGETFRTS